MADKYVVRLYDGFDNEWMDVSEPVSKEEAEAIWRKKTNGGRQKTSYGDIDYYAVYPADTVMKYSEGRGEKAAGRNLSSLMINEARAKELLDKTDIPTESVQEILNTLFKR